MRRSVANNLVMTLAMTLVMARVMALMGACVGRGRNWKEFVEPRNNNCELVAAPWVRAMACRGRGLDSWSRAVPWLTLAGRQQILMMTLVRHNPPGLGLQNALKIVFD